MTSVPASAEESRLPRLRVQQVVGGLEVPWDVQQLDRGRLLVTERDRARLSLVVHGRRHTVSFPRDDVWVSGETGLMSLAVDAGFAQNRRIHLCHGGRRADGHDVRVVSWRLEGHRLADRRVLVKGLPSTSGRHGGCRLLVDSEGSLLVGTGDSARSGVSRDLDRLGGKVLRLDPATGDPWPTNPWAGDERRRRYVLTYGHRNVQGLAQRADGTLWSVEHGSSRDDEVNLLQSGGDYGWDPGPGYDERVPMTDHRLPGRQVEARWSSGRPTLATSGAAWVRGREWGRLQGTLAVAALKASRLVFMKFDDRGRLQWTRAPRAMRQFGRLRSVTSTASGDLLVTTSNGARDRVLRVSPR
ncbi:PQQ-dependent sugar dehydrogenase [Nocardioides gansuensis]|nr:PQQ-dependent sugar dehydrogenase [Nocardioides gansuensis]